MNRRGRWALVLVLLLVNGAAVWGQAGWALEHIVPAGWDWRAGLALALAFASAIELIGVFLALSADDAEDRSIPSGGIRLSSYAIGIVSGALNYSHWSGAAAIAFALLSAISPFLWGINSRVNRARPIAPSRRFWHPLRSVALIRYMAWEGIALEPEGIASIQAQARLARQRSAERADRNREAVKRIEAGLITPPAIEQTPAHPSPASEREYARRQRATSADQRKAIELLIEGKPEEAVPALMGASTMRRYAAVLRDLKQAPQGPINERARKVQPELVEMIRAAVAS